jgi:hypothetical protein
MGMDYYNCDLCNDIFTDYSEGITYTRVLGCPKEISLCLCSECKKLVEVINDDNIDDYINKMTDEEREDVLFKNTDNDKIQVSENIVALRTIKHDEWYKKIKNNIDRVNYKLSLLALLIHKLMKK